MDNWKIRMVFRPAEMIADIYIFRRNNKNNVDIWFDEKTSKEYDSGASNMPPSLSLSEDLLPLLLEALEKGGIKAPSQSYTEGKLITMEKHLEDMRTLVFKKK